MILSDSSFNSFSTSIFFVWYELILLLKTDSFLSKSVLFTKLQTLGILFSTAARALVVAKLVMSSISSLASFILALRAVLVAKLVISGVSPLS